MEALIAFLALRWLIRHIWHLMIAAVVLVATSVVITWVLLVAQALGFWPPHLLKG